MGSAAVYKRYKKDYIIHGYVKTQSGFRIASAPFFNIPSAQVNVSVIVEAIKNALRNNDELRVPTPKDWQQSKRDFLKNIGLKSLKELENASTQHISVQAKDQKIIFTPSQPATNYKGFLYKNKTLAIEVSIAASDDAIIEALEQVFDRCG